MNILKSKSNQKIQSQYFDNTGYDMRRIHMITKISFVALVFALCASYAVAGERLGVTVYPGATLELVMTEELMKSPSIEGAAYRTDDGMAKVTEFYRKQGLIFLRLGHPAKESARFKKPDTGVDVVVQSPWKDPRTGAMMKDTLILIIKDRE